MAQVVSPVSDNSNTSSDYVVLGQEQSTEETIQCRHCNSYNPSSSQTCSRCNNTLSSSITGSNSTPQQTTLLPNGPPPPPRDATHEEPSLNVTQEPEVRATAPSQFNPSNRNAAHLFAPNNADKYPQEEQLFGNFAIRSVYHTFSLLLFCVLSFNLWFSKEVASSFQSAFNLAASGSFFIFLGTICCLLWITLTTKNIKFPKVALLQYVAMGLLFLGGGLYFIAGCVLAAAYNKTGIKHVSAYAGIWFCEMTFVATHAIICGIDIWKRMLNTHGKRLLMMSVILFCLSLIMFFACAVWSTTLESKVAGFGLQAFGYFGVTVLLPLFIVIKVCLTLKHKVQLVADGVIAVAVSVFIMFVVFGYLSFSGEDALDTDHMSGYWIGFGFFLLLQGIIVVMDIQLEKMLPCNCTKKERTYTEAGQDRNSLTENMLTEDDYDVLSR